jgi:hypothetical protein
MYRQCAAGVVITDAAAMRADATRALEAAVYNIDPIAPAGLEPRGETTGVTLLVGGGQPCRLARKK